MMNSLRLLMVLVLMSLSLGGVLWLSEGVVVGEEVKAEPAKTQKQHARYAHAELLFATKIYPLLETKCFACHGGKEKIKGGLDLTTRAGLLKGGETEGAALVPGHAAKSPMWVSVTWKDDLLEMPPKENDRLDEKQIGLLKEWIDAGAPWADEKRRSELVLKSRAERVNEDGMLVDTSGGLSDTWTYRRYQPEDVWGYLPVKRPHVPLVKGYEGGHPIDSFVRAKLVEKGIEPAERADKRTLIRRATYDLTGLPPTPAEVEAFLNDTSEDAWEKVIDRLLASKHYGERWGQHWLDVVRYADTAGYSNDYERSNAWRYRDYVIRSFNEDKPYDEFVMEQLAGDEMRADDPEMLVAVGFLRMGPWGTAMVPQPIARQAYLDDVVHSVGQTFLATAMRCAKCHDHKFDPIPTRDYYRMYAAFATTQPAEREAAFVEGENLAGFEEGKAHVEALLAYADRDRLRIVKKREDAARAWYKKHGKDYVSHEARKKLPDDEKPPRHVGLDHVDEGTLKVREQDVRIWTRRLERYQPMAQSVFNGPIYWYDGKKLRIPAKPNKKWKPHSSVYMGGSLEARGPWVTPGVLSSTPAVVEGTGGDDPYRLPDDFGGRRLKLAKWIANEDNTLATRSIVNRIWQYHFGRGIVRTSNNFGVKGSKPTHPELLDWLTDEFLRGDWKMKRMHKLIMMSETYQQSTEHEAASRLAEIDPNNDLMAYFEARRMTAEELRDSMLKISGELNPMMGGLPVMPEINMEVALQPRMIQFSIAPAHQPSRTPEMRNRRTIYTYRVRGQADPFLETFNLPNPNESCELRESSSVSPQALTLLNSDLMQDRAIAFALRLRGERESLDEQLKQAYRLVYGRDATGAEVKQMGDYVGEMVKYHRKHEPKQVVYPTEVTRSLVEEFSGEPFEYTEWLRVFEDYVPDKKPADVNAEVRALADACLLLFNSNEFVYVY